MISMHFRLCDELPGLNATRQRGKNGYMFSFALKSIANGLNMAGEVFRRKLYAYVTLGCQYLFRGEPPNLIINRFFP